MGIAILGRDHFVGIPLVTLDSFLISQKIHDTMQTPSSTSTSRSTAQPLSNRTLGRLALVSVLLAIVIFGIEFTLASLRTRERTIGALGTELRFTRTPFPAGVAITPTPTLNPLRNTPTPSATPLNPFIEAGDAVIVPVSWDYRIGPRFGQSAIRASVRIKGIAERVVAQNSFIIQCGDQVLECKGRGEIKLNYTLNDGNQILVIPWPTGEYVITVEENVSGNKFLPVREYTFRVR